MIRHILLAGVSYYCQHNLAVEQTASINLFLCYGHYYGANPFSLDGLNEA